MNLQDRFECWLVRFSGWLVYGAAIAGAIGIGICIFNPDLR